jgi:hypothetical protein
LNAIIKYSYFWLSGAEPAGHKDRKEDYIKMPLTERQNLQLVFDHKQPEWVPLMEEASDFGMNGFLMQWYKPGEVSTDIFGAKYYTEDPRVGPMPIPGEPLVKDIAKWRDVVKVPDLSSVDWVEAAKNDTANWDRENKYQSIMFGGSANGAVFQLMVTLMSHEGALFALADEESEEHWHELLGTMTDWTEELIRKTIRHYKPDGCMIGDDLTNRLGPFMSPATFRRMLKPYHKQLVDAIVDEGCMPTLHCCGKTEKLFGDLVDIGYKMWDPTQVFNDLGMMKEKYGNDVVFCGGFDSQGLTNKAGTPEETVREGVRRSFEILAPGGGYCFSTSGMMLAWDIGEAHAGWIMDEAKKQSRSVYKK